MTTRSTCLISSLALIGLVACQRQQGLTGAEAAQASEELQIDTQSQALTTNTVELSTNFTIGGAVEKAATELGAFIQSQLACADVSVSGHTLTVQYGVTGTCLFNGLSFHGTHEITISKNDAADVVVDHVWTDLTNGKVEVSGTAEVTWSLKDTSRHVVHDLKWTRLSDGRTGEGRGDRTQRPLANGGLKVGFSEDGHRSWDGKLGHWDLAINHLDMRWVDPLPQAGSVTLDTPFDKTVSAVFSRPKPTTIRITLEGPRGSLDVDVMTPP
jgi:hypothetical protein